PPAILLVIVVGLVPVNKMPLPAAIVVDGTEAHGTRFPPLSKQAPRFARLAAAVRIFSVSPGGASTARPVTSLILSQTSRFWATRSVIVWLKSRAATPRFSATCEVRRGQRAPTIWTVPVWAFVNVSTASVIGRARVARDPDGLVIVQPLAGSLNVACWPLIQTSTQF